MIILESLWFFLPTLVANQCPGFAARFNLPGSHKPVSRHWLGENKTLAAYYIGPLGAIAVIYAQQQMTGWCLALGLFNYNRSDLWLIGFLFGLGAVIGDHAKSFVKRRIGIPPGERWWPFDQLDFVVGGLVMAILVIGWVGWERAALICLFVLLIHPLGNRIGYWLGLRRVPW